jgi:ribosomal-protein-alanine N-acetyltransferase
MITTERLLLRQLTTGDAQALLDVLLANRAFLQPTNPRLDAGYYTLAGVLGDIERRVTQQAHDTGYGFGIFSRSEGALIGRINLAQVFRGAFQSCVLGYWLAERHNGQGLMSETVPAVVEHAFHTLGLHRIQAGTLLNNLASQRVLVKAGFHRIGVSPRYLQIDGRWQDHVLFAITAEDR